MAEDKFVKVAVTKGGKEFGYKLSKNKATPGLVEICFSSGGEVPSILKGAWTPYLAKKEILSYVDRLHKTVEEEKKNAAASKQTKTKAKKQVSKKTKTKAKEG